MGIVNITPDSFFADSRVSDQSALASAVEKMIAEGCDIIDVGCCSTRPGATPCDEATELSRLREGMAALSRVTGETLFSIDTFRPEVARVAVEEYGFHIVNDVSGGNEEMFRLVAGLGVPYVLTHPGNHFDYSEKSAAADNDIASEVLQYLGQRLKNLQLAGVGDVIVDPGFGFGKDVEANMRLLATLGVFHDVLGRPVLAGLSRKSMITRTLGCEPGEALNGTTVMNTVALLEGASILRVHDVAEAVQAVRLVDELRRCHESQQD